MAELIPNANSPQLLTRLLEFVGRGVRSSRGLQEALGVNQRTVRYYLHAGSWLGFLDPEEERTLTPLGLQFVFGTRSRPTTYAAAVWANSFVEELMVGKGRRMPTTVEIAEAITYADPNLSPSTVRRRASAVRSLIRPAVARIPKTPKDRQLDLPLARPTPDTEPINPIAPDREYDPDVYRLLFCTLLEHGELSPGHIRGLLDRVGGQSVPIGGYIDLFVRRGDARRIGDRLIVTRGAMNRRELGASTTSIILSDPGYRAYLADRTASSKGDLSAKARSERNRARYSAWDLRLLGQPLDVDDLANSLRKVLLDRPLSAFPLASPNTDDSEVTAVCESFLDVWDRAELLIAMPPLLPTLHDRVAGVNRALREARVGEAKVGTPSMVERNLVAHAGILHPGEPLPTSIPDNRTLRLRLVLNAPFVSLTVALLLVHRSNPSGIRLVHSSGRWQALRGDDVLGELLDLLDEFARYRQWLPSRSPRRGATASELLGALEVLGLTFRCDDVAVLNESFFARMRSDAEEMEIHDQLSPLVRALEGWLAELPPKDDR